MRHSQSIKKRIAVILAVFVSVTYLTIVSSPKAFADDTVIASGECGVDGDNVTWELTGTDTDMVLTISGSGEMADFTESSIPWASKRSKIKILNIQHLST